MNRIRSVLLIGLAVSLGASCSEPIAEPEYSPPEAEAGPNQALRDSDGDGREPVFLDGSASRRGSRQIVRWEWTEGKSPVIGWSEDSRRSLQTDVAVGRHTFVLTVTDDTGRSVSDMVSIEVLAPDPTIGILLPGNGTTHATGRDLHFQGYALDQYESVLVGAQLVWRSDLDGEIGTGMEFERSDLSNGTHVITLQGTDRDGFVGSASVEITLVEPPIVTILEPEDGRSFYWADDVDLAGTCSDPDGGPTADWAAIWSVSGDGSVSRDLQAVAEFVSPGPHAVTLKCVEEQGVSGEASVAIDVVVSFAANIQPMLELFGCPRCHSGAGPAGGISLDSYEAITEGGNANGPLIARGDASQGSLMSQLEMGHEQPDPDDFPYSWWGWDPNDPYVNFDGWWAQNVLGWWIDAGAPNN